METLETLNHLKNYKVSNVKEPFQKKNLRNFDASSIPPCTAELRPHFLRSMYISRMWSQAYQKIPTTLVPEDCGWIEDKYEFRWFDGPQMPRNTVQEIIIDEQQIEGDANEVESDEESDWESEDNLQYDESDINSDTEDVYLFL